MVSAAMLWAPILLSAVLVFVASSVIHMVLGYHHSDFGKVAGEDDGLETFRRLKLAPGDYVMPRPASGAEARSPEFVAKAKNSPMVVLTVLPAGGFPMGRNLALWFVYTVIVSLFAGYVAGLTLGVGAEYRPVFRVTSTVAFASYVLALWQGVIWFGRSVSTAGKATFDGLVFALVTGGTFGWLWP
jgi:hypothetical protein